MIVSLSLSIYIYICTHAYTSYMCVYIYIYIYIYICRHLLGFSEPKRGDPAHLNSSISLSGNNYIDILIITQIIVIVMLMT